MCNTREKSSRETSKSTCTCTDIKWDNVHVCVCTDVQTPYKQDKSKASITFSFSRNLLWHFCPIANTLEWLIAVCSHFAKRKDRETERKREKKSKKNSCLWQVKLSQHRLEWRAVKLLLVYFKLWKICANFPPNKKYITMGSANSNEWACECECECESRKRQMSRRGNAEGRRANAQTRWKCSTICCEICALCVFSNNAKTFRLCTEQGHDGKRGEGWETRLLSRRMRTSWQQPAALQRSSFQYTFVSLPPLSCVFAQNAISHICITADRAQIAQIAQNKVEICSARRSAVLWLHH